MDEIMVGVADAEVVAVRDDEIVELTHEQLMQLGGGTVVVLPL